VTFGESISTCSGKYADFNGRARLIVSIIFGLAVFLPSLAASVRRLHDTGKSGAAILIALVPFVGSIILIVWLATAGIPGPNQYGELPAK